MSKICEYLEKAFLLMNISYKCIPEKEKILYQLTFPETGVFCGKINELNGEYRFIRIVMDKNNDIYSCQQFILFGNEELMCKQIVTNLVAFYDLHGRAVRKILEAMRKK